MGVDRAAEAEYVPREIALDGADELVDLVAPAQLDVGIDVAGTGRVELLDQLATRPLIVFDPPFRWFAPRDFLEAATTDENYGAMTRFFRQARRHLADGGRMLIFFGTSGDLAIQQLINHGGFHSEVVARRNVVEDGWNVDYFTFRLTCDQRPILGRLGAACSAPTHLRRAAAGGDPAV